MNYIKLFETFKEAENSRGQKMLTFTGDQIKQENLVGGYTLGEVESNEFSFSTLDYRGKALKTYNYNGDEYLITELMSKNGKYSYEFGTIVLKNDELAYVVGIYEQHGSGFNADKGVLTVYGHENVINLYLSDGTFDNYHTR